MKQWAGMRWGMAAVLLCAVAAFAGNRAGDKKEKSKSLSQTVDSGSFGVFVKGQRVVTEVFHIQQENGNSSIKSQLKEAAGSPPIDQKSDLEITGSGELLRYEWSQASQGLVLRSGCVPDAANPPTRSSNDWRANTLCATT